MIFSTFGGSLAPITAKLADTSALTLYTAPVTVTALVHQLYIANTSAGAVDFTLSVTNSADTPITYAVYSAYPISANTTLSIDNAAILLLPGWSLKATAETGDTLEIVGTISLLSTTRGI